MTDAAATCRPGSIEAVRAHAVRRDAPRPLAKDVIIVADDELFWECVLGAPVATRAAGEDEAEGEG